jgi:hypothetical protein
MKSLSSKTYQCGVTIQGLTTLSGTVYLTGITNTASWDHVIVGTTAQGQIYTRTYAQFMGDVATGISLSSYVTGSGTTNYLPKFTGGSALGNSQIFDNGTNVGIGTTSPNSRLSIGGVDNGSGVGVLELFTSGGTNLKLGGNIDYSWIQSHSSKPLRINELGNNVILNLGGGNVGIGTSSPVTKLEVNGTVTISGPSAVKWKYSDNYAYFGIGYISGADYGFYNYNYGRSDLYIQQSTGNIGIGTSSPREKLQIVGNTVIGSAGLNSYKTNLYLTYNAGSDETWVRIYVPQDYNSSNNGGTIRVRVLWEGDHATFGAYQEYQISYKTFYPSSPYLKFSNVLCTNKTSDFATGATYYPPTSTPDVIFYDNTDGYLYVKVKGTHTAYNTARYIEAEIFGRTTAQPTIATTSAPGAPVELTKTIQFLPQEGNIYASGSIGIGTTGPSQKLHLYGSGNQLLFIENTGTYHLYAGLSSNVGIVGSNNATPLSLQTNGVSRVYLDTTGNVGIGTTSPSAKLDVAGDIRLGGTATYNSVSVYNNSASGGGGYLAYQNGVANAYFGTAGWYIGNSDTGAIIGTDSSSRPIRFYTNTERMRITGNGNIGIGTTSPGGKLQIADGSSGTTNDSSTTLYVENDGSSNSFYVLQTATFGGGKSFNVTNAGNVGIGTTSPTTKLDVNGVITATGGNSTNWNTAYSWDNHASYSYATTSYVTTQINNLINGAPGVLDTLDELAAALGDDSNFATTVTNSIATKLPLAGGTMSGTISFINNIGTALQGTVGDNDFWRIYANSTSSNAGYLEIATSDDGTEPIYVRQYTGVFSSLTRTATLLDGSGNTSFPGNLTVGGTITESSSIKLKENVETSEGNLEKVVNLRPVTYNKIGSQTKELGLIAEEVAEVYPEFVQYDENGEPVGVNYSRLTAALIGAVKELTQRIETLENNG